MVGPPPVCGLPGDLRLTGTEEDAWAQAFTDEDELVQYAVTLAAQQEEMRALKNELVMKEDSAAGINEENEAMRRENVILKHENQILTDHPLAYGNAR